MGLSLVRLKSFQIQIGTREVNRTSLARGRTSLAKAEARFWITQASPDHPADPAGLVQALSGLVQVNPSS
jgi:hypothetical protein